jgi:CRISPR-associated protein Cmr1
MQTITFTCETITPMFLSGADGSTPELRPPSIKGALRFWWRAMNGHLRLEDLKKQEALIFGGTEPAQRSRVIVVRKQNFKNEAIGKEFMLPHKPEKRLKSEQNAFMPNNDFVLELKLTQDKIFYENQGIKVEIMNETKLINLFVITCCLGGFGRRSRRGFGSVRVKNLTINGVKKENFKMPKTLQEIYSYLNTSHFIMNANDISTSFEQPYPCIQKIEISNKVASVLKIAETTHKIKGIDDKNAQEDEKYKKQYPFALGNGGRFASPIYVNLLKVDKETKAIITTLNTIPKEGWTLNPKGEKLQNNFKAELL